MAVSRAALELLPTRYTGTFVGVFGAAVCFGKIFYAFLFEVLLHRDLFVFFSCVAVLFAVLPGLCYLLLYQAVSDQKKRSQMVCPEETSLIGQGDVLSVLSNGILVFDCYFVDRLFEVGDTLRKGVSDLLLAHCRTQRDLY